MKKREKTRSVEFRVGAVKRLGSVCISYFQIEVAKGEKQESRLKKK